MKTILLAALLITSAAYAQTLPAVPATPQRVIIDTDLSYDLDDAQAVAIALRLRQLGYYNIEAITTSTWLDKAPAFVNLLLAHGGLTTADIPIGAFQGARPAGSGGTCSGVGDNYAASTLNAFPGVVPNVGRASFPSALSVQRAVLAGSPNASVTFIILGGHTNVAALLQSPANAGGDGFASGQSLWDTKVVRVVSQLSGYPPFPFTQSPYNSGTPAFNSSCDPVATQYVFTHNGAVPIIGAPLTVSMELGGCYDGTGAGCTSSMPSTSPVRIATGYFRAAGGAFTLGSGNHGRQYAWDPSATFYAMVGTTDPGGGAYFSLSSPGTYSVVTSPISQTWSTSTNSNHYFAINSSRWAVEQTAMDNLLMADYQPIAPSHPRLLLNDTVSDTWDPGYPGGGINGRLSAIAARANGGNVAAAADWASLRALAPTGGTPNFANASDEGNLDGVLVYALNYLLYHKLGNDASADPYALALYNGLKSATLSGATYPVYNITRIDVSGNLETVTLASAPGAEITAGADIGVWGCALAQDAYCGSKTITSVSGNTFSFPFTAPNITITDSGMVTTRSYLGLDGKGFGGIVLSEWGYFYDYCNPWIVANSHTAEVINYIKAAYWAATLTRQSSAFSQNIRESDFHNYSVWPESAIMEAGIALNGDDPLGAAMYAEGIGYLYQGISVRPAAIVNSTYTYNIKASTDNMTEGAFNEEGSQYMRNAAPRIFRAIEAADAASGRSSDLWNTQFSNAQNYGFYRIYARDPGGSVTPFGESYQGLTFAKENPGLAIINDRFPDPHLVYMMATVINSWHDGASNAGLLWKLLFYPYVNGPGSHDFTDLPLSRRFGADVVIRSGWGANDTLFTITGWMPGIYHRKADAGSFTLYHGNYLALASNYKTVEYPVYDGYMKRTVASNGITIYDSTDCWMDNIPTCGVNSLGEKLTNDGGQRTTLRRLNPPFTLSELEVSRTWSGSLFTDPTFSAVYGELNSVQFPALTSGSGYERVTVDVTKAYTNAYSGSGHNVHAKTTLTGGVVRDVVHFQPVGGSIDPVIIFDKVTATNASFPKSWIVHTAGAPQLTGSWTAASTGIASTSSSVMRADNGTGRMYVQSLLPASPTMRTVGGNSCAPLVITDWTSANPGVTTIVNHGLTVGERVAFDVGTYSPAQSNNFNIFGVHPNPWLLDDYDDGYEFIVSSVIDASHVIFKTGGSPWNTTSFPSFTSVFNNVGTGAPVISGFAGKVYYQSDAASGNTTWIHNGSAWQHIGSNGNGLTAPTLYKHTNCDYSYWVDQAGPQGSSGANLWTFPQDMVNATAKPEWRVEVRPSAQATTDYFLNVLTPTTTSNSTGPTTTSITATGWTGAQVSDGVETFVAMFAQTAGASGVAYTATHTGGAVHVVTGFAASTAYPVTQGITSLGTITADASGAVRFAETGGGAFVVGTTSQSGTAGATTIHGKAKVIGRAISR